MTGHPMEHLWHLLLDEPELELWPKWKGWLEDARNALPCPKTGVEMIVPGRGCWRSRPLFGGARVVAVQVGSDPGLIDMSVQLVGRTETVEVCGQQVEHMPPSVRKAYEAARTAQESTPCAR